MRIPWALQVIIFRSSSRLEIRPRLENADPLREYACRAGKIDTQAENGQVCQNTIVPESPVGLTFTPYQSGNIILTIYHVVVRPLVSSMGVISFPHCLSLNSLFHQANFGLAYETVSLYIQFLRDASSGGRETSPGRYTSLNFDSYLLRPTWTPVSLPSRALIIFDTGLPACGRWVDIHSDIPDSAVVSRNVVQVLTSSCGRTLTLKITDKSNA